VTKISNLKATSKPAIKTIPPLLAQSIIIFCIAASFALPYLAFEIKEYYENKAWLATGMYGYEIDDWKRENISTEIAVRWRNAGFKPPHASIWIKYGFNPEDAGQWNDNGIWPSEAKSWEGKGFKVKEALAWKACGFYYTEASEWRAGGVTPKDAARRKQKGEWPPKK